MGCCDGATVSDPWSVGEAASRREAMFNAMLASGKPGCEFMERIRDLTSGLEHVAYVGAEPLIGCLAMLAGQPRELRAFGASDDLYRLAGDIAGETRMYVRTVPGNNMDCQLLLMDVGPVAIWPLLDRYAPQVSERIVSLGSWKRLEEWAGNQPDWRVEAIAEHNGGLAILKRN